MVHPLTERMCAQLDQLDLAAPQAAAARRMVQYFDRSSLWLAAIEGQGADAVLIFANEAERFRLPLAQVLALAAQLAAGQPLDWNVIERLR